jgi:hypothetical protein
LTKYLVEGDVAGYGIRMLGGQDASGSLKDKGEEGGV